MIKDEILLARVLAFVPGREYISVASIALAHLEKYGDDVSVSKIAALLKKLLEEKLVERKEKSQHFGILWAYKVVNNEFGKN